MSAGEHQAGTTRSALTPGYPVRQQVIDALGDVKGTGTVKKINGRELKLRTALHSIIGEWLGVIESGEVSKEAFQKAAYSAVDREEPDDSDFHLRDQLVLLERAESSISTQLETLSLCDNSEQKVVSLNEKKTATNSEIKDLKAQVDRRQLDVFFLTARAVGDALETAQWGMDPEHSSTSGASAFDRSNQTLREAVDGMKAIAEAIDAKHGKAVYEDPKADEEDSDADTTPEDSGDKYGASESSHDKRKGKKRPNWTDEEDLQLLDIWHANPTATWARQASEHNACMRSTFPAWRDRTQAAISKHFKERMPSEV